MEDSKKYIQQAVVSIGSNLCDEEKKFLQTRTQMIKKSLETALGMSLQDNQVPRIALCASGGGNRAMLTTLGALDGGTIPNTSLNIMDICTYFSTLSGSTWALTGLEYSKMPPGDFIDHLAQHMYQGILDDFNMQDLVLELKKKEMNNQPISFVNVYGILLAQKILKGLGADHPSAIELTCCTAIFDEVKMPLSIKTSVIGNNDLNEWTEFTPYQVGSTYLQTFIPTWAFGRKFENGFSVDFAPPQSIGFCLGIWSSAMCIDPKDFIKFVVKPNLDEAEASFVDNAIAPIATMVYNTLSKLGISYLKKDNADNPLAALSAHRIYPAEIFNWNLGIKDVPLNTEKTLALVDSGHAFNFPLPALLRKERDVDIIIIIDASDTPKDEWDNAERYIKEHNLPFPSIDRTQFNKTCSVHADPAHPDAPIIIYFPLIKNSTYKDNWDPWSVSFTGTFNEKYTQEQVHLLSGLAHSNMAQGMPIIMDTIKQWIENKKNNA